MSVSLLSNLSLITNGSAYHGVHSTFPPPIAPDVVRCASTSLFVGNLPMLGECRSAWDLLPSGSKVYPWYTSPKTSPESKSQLRLPIVVGDRNCRIQFSASGKYAEEVNFHLYISGNTMRGLAGRVIEDCVENGGATQQIRYGGVGTKYIRRTLDWLVERDTVFPQSLDIPISTTFLTVLVYAGPEATDYEPGAQCALISRVLLDWIDAAAGRLIRESPFWGVLANRFFYIWMANEEQKKGLVNVPHWWDVVQARPGLELGRASGTNDTSDGVSIARRGARKRIW